MCQVLFCKLFATNTFITPQCFLKSTIEEIPYFYSEGLTQAQIGEKIGWSREQVRNYIFVLDKVGTEVLDLARKHQNGRVPKNGTIVPFDFTEGWFRNI